MSSTLRAYLEVPGTEFHDRLVEAAPQAGTTEAITGGGRDAGQDTCTESVAKQVVGAQVPVLSVTVACDRTVNGTPRGVVSPALTVRGPRTTGAIRVAAREGENI